MKYLNIKTFLIFSLFIVFESANTINAQILDQIKYRIEYKEVGCIHEQNKRVNLVMLDSKAIQIEYLEWFTTGFSLNKGEEFKSNKMECRSFISKHNVQLDTFYSDIKDTFLTETIPIGLHKLCKIEWKIVGTEKLTLSKTISDKKLLDIIKNMDFIDCVNIAGSTSSIIAYKISQTSDLIESVVYSNEKHATCTNPIYSMIDYLKNY